MSSSVLEIEKKAYLKESRETVKNRLRDLYPDFKNSGVLVKSDLYFTTDRITKYEQIKTQPFIFRIRMVDDLQILTLKEKTLEGNTEVNKELEVIINKENISAIEDFFKKIGARIQTQDWGDFWACLTKKDWIPFLERKGFFFLIDKTKTTELFKGSVGEYPLSIEFNLIKDLAEFIEIETICTDSKFINQAVKTIDDLFTALKIPKEDEEPRLYLELLFLSQNKHC